VPQHSILEGRAAVKEGDGGSRGRAFSPRSMPKDRRGRGAETPVCAAGRGVRAAVFLAFAGYAPVEVGSSRTTTDFEVGVLLTAAVESSGTRTLVSGK